MAEKTEKRSLGRFLPFALIAVLIGGLVWLVLSIEGEPRLDRSAIGMNGLTALLQEEGLEARNFHGGGALSPEGIGLRVLPLYDTDPAVLSGNPVGGGEDARYLNGEIRAIFEGVIGTKIETLPTLIILPKWRDGVRLAGYLHPEFLLGSDIPRNAEPEAVPETASTAAAPEATEQDDRLVDPEIDNTEETKPDPDEDWDVEGFAGEGDYTELEYRPAAFGGFRRIASDAPVRIEEVSLTPYLSGQATLYAPQYAAAPLDCEALVGTADRGLLFECHTAGHLYWVLSDPDLLNNHGLARGENAELAVALIRELADGGAILVDHTVQPWLSPDLSEYGRSLSDLLRFLDPPFRWLWLAALVFLIVLLWRGGVRGLPLVRQFTEGHGAARMTALAAQAKLMRRSRADGALLKTLLSAHIATLAERMLGRDSNPSHREARVLRALDHREKAVAEAFEASIAEIRALPDQAGPDLTIPALSRLEKAYKKALKLT